MHWWYRTFSETDCAGESRCLWRGGVLFSSYRGQNLSKLTLTTGHIERILCTFKAAAGSVACWQSTPLKAVWKDFEVQPVQMVSNVHPISSCLPNRVLWCFIKERKTVLWLLVSLSFNDNTNTNGFVLPLTTNRSHFPISFDLQEPSGFHSFEH